MFFNKKKEKFWKPEYEILAHYNSEVARGIKHTDGWNRRMSILQAEYNSRRKEFAIREGYMIVQS
jgi:hypothetical protein